MDSDDVFELEQAEERAGLVLRSLERKYFCDLEPISSIEVIDDPTYASCYLPESKTIRLNFGVARFATLTQFLILHELIHHKLTLLDANYADSPYGDVFLAEARDLVQRGAYDKLL